jgi:hypothetical protein
MAEIAVPKASVFAISPLPHFANEQIVSAVDLSLEAKGCLRQCKRESACWVMHAGNLLHDLHSQ